MAGATLSSMGGYRGSVTVPQGLNFMMGDVLTPNGILSKPIPSFQTEVHVDKFYIDYYDNGEVYIFLELQPGAFFLLHIIAHIKRRKEYSSSSQHLITLCSFLFSWLLFSV